MTQDGEHPYRNASGVIVMCMHCRRTLRGEDQWVLVPEFLSERPENVIDGLCGDCLEKYYPRS